MDRCIVDFEPVGRRIEVEKGLDLLTIAQRAGVELVAACGGMGICATCLVRLEAGDLSPLTLTEQEQLSPEQIAAGFRLACQAQVLSRVKIEIPPESLPAAQKLQVDGREAAVSLDPGVQAVDLVLEAPHLGDLRSDLTRVNDALGVPLHGELANLVRLSETLRAQGWQGRLAIDREQQLTSLLREGDGVRLVTILPPQTPLLGLAVDVGSTKLALYLVNLETGGTLGTLGLMNPQISYGEDVVSRIAFANKSHANRKLLQTRLLETLNQGIGELCQKNSANRAQIVAAVVVGNTAMHHFFCGLPVEQLGSAPYVPAVSEALRLRAAEVGLDIAPAAQIYLPPNIAGYVGADHTAALLATHSYAAGQTAVLVDIGTNTEISLIHHGRTWSCSTASGPAFEGAHIHDGMRAAPGAIERVELQDGEVRVHTVGGQPAIGICGTGILNAIAEMRRAGLVDQRGALGRDHHQVRRSSGRSEFVLVPAAQSGNGRDIIINRKDINEIQLAKAAIRTGIDLCLAEAGLRAGDVQSWVIAGAFGTYLDLRAALRLGMFPNAPLERFHQVGNAAGVGARQMLLSLQRRAEVHNIIAGVTYIELTIHPRFTETFVESMYLR